MRAIASANGIPTGDDRGVMGTVKVGGLDLNLLLALDALLAEANVTRAAERLNLTQPTLSQSLGRLRKHFNDELLFRHGNDMELTPLALQLRPLVTEAIVSAGRVFSAHQAFDPLSTRRRFVVAASDYGVGALGARWSARVSRQAPNARIAFRSLSFELLTMQDARIRDLDGIIAPTGSFDPDMPHIDVLTDRWVIIADPSNTAVSERPHLSQLSEMRWVTTFEPAHVTPSGLSRGEWASLARRVDVVVDSFAEIPMFVRGTGRVALIQERLLAAVNANKDLRLLPPAVPR